jgi:hypothetical protein
MQSQTFNISQLKPTLAFSFFCGILKIKSDAIDQISKRTEFIPWQTHVFKDNTRNVTYDRTAFDASNSLIKDLSDLYYTSFIHCLFPNENQRTQFSANTKSFTTRIDEPVIINNRSFVIDYIDLFLFPENHLVYCFRCDVSAFTFDEIVLINNLIRVTEIGKLSFLLKLLQPISDSDCYNIGNKLKLFSVIEHKLEFSDLYNEDNLLYELGTCSPIGTTIGYGNIHALRPSQSYYRDLISTNKISVFENWSALCLFDTFTVLHRGEVYWYNWEFRYFRLLYIHSLFLKSYLGEINKEFYLDNKRRDLEVVFHEFDKHFNIKQISYNFLPQLIYEKIRQGLNIEHELTDIRFSIEQDYIKKQERRQLQEAESDKRTNKALLVVALLAVFSAVWDGAELIEAALKGERGVVFSSISLLALISIYLGIIYFLRKKK